MGVYQQNLQCKSEENSPNVIFNIILKMCHITSKTWQLWSTKTALPKNYFNYSPNLFKPTFMLTVSTNFPWQNNSHDDFVIPVTFVALKVMLPFG